MESFFSFSTLFNLVLTVIWFISGIRDLQGKDPFINLMSRLPSKPRARLWATDSSVELPL